MSEPNLPTKAWPRQHTAVQPCLADGQAPHGPPHHHTINPVHDHPSVGWRASPVSHRDVHGRVSVKKKACPCPRTAFCGLRRSASPCAVMSQPSQVRVERPWTPPCPPLHIYIHTAVRAGEGSGEITRNDIGMDNGLNPFRGGAAELGWNEAWKGSGQGPKTSGR